jgi:hypothetical protein
LHVLLWVKGGGGSENATSRLTLNPEVIDTAAVFLIRAMTGLFYQKALEKVVQSGNRTKAFAA